MYLTLIICLMIYRIFQETMRTNDTVEQLPSNVSIHCTKRVVQQVDVSALIDRPGQWNTLLLTTRQVDTLENRLAVMTSSQLSYLERSAGTTAAADFDISKYLLHHIRNISSGARVPFLQFLFCHHQAVFLCLDVARMLQQLARIWCRSQPSRTRRFPSKYSSVSRPVVVRKPVIDSVEQQTK